METGRRSTRSTDGGYLRSLWAVTLGGPLHGSPARCANSIFGPPGRGSKACKYTRAGYAWGRGCSERLRRCDLYLPGTDGEQVFRSSQYPLLVGYGSDQHEIFDWDTGTKPVHPQRILTAGPRDVLGLRRGEPI